MDQFKKKSLLELRKITVEELTKYHAELRKYRFDQGKQLRGIQIRKIVSRLCVAIVKIDRLLSKETIEIINDRRVPTKRSKIYAFTHCGGNDIERVFEAIKDHAYLFLGDPGETYRTEIGLLLFGNGVINLETRDKLDRHLGYLQCIELLSKRGNLLIFPEGAWNIYEHKPVAELYDGASKLGIETGSDIIPGAIEQYGNNFKINIGKNISTLNRRDITSLTSQLRDELATLKYEIFETEPKYKSTPSTKQAIWEGVSVLEQEMIFRKRADEYGQSIVDRCDLDYTLQDVYETRYHSDIFTADQLIAEIQQAIQENNVKQQNEKRLKFVAQRNL